MDGVDESHLFLGAGAKGSKNRSKTLASQSNECWNGEDADFDGTYADFLEGEVLDLIRASAPVNGRQEALPNALHEFTVGQGLLLLFSSNSSNDLEKNILSWWLP